VQAGDQVADRYRIEREVGRGAHGVVFAAHDEHASPLAAQDHLRRLELALLEPDLALEQWILRCLERDPDRRPSAAQIAAGLHALHRQRTTGRLANVPPPLAFLSPAKVAGAILLLVAAGVGLALGLRRREPQRVAARQAQAEPTEWEEPAIRVRAGRDPPVRARDARGPRPERRGRSRRAPRGQNDRLDRDPRPQGRLDVVPAPGLGALAAGGQRRADGQAGLGRGPRPPSLGAPAPS